LPVCCIDPLHMPTVLDWSSTYWIVVVMILMRHWPILSPGSLTTKNYQKTCVDADPNFFVNCYRNTFSSPLCSFLCSPQHMVNSVWATKTIPLCTVNSKINVNLVFIDKFKVSKSRMIKRSVVALIQKCVVLIILCYIDHEGIKSLALSTCFV